VTGRDLRAWARVPRTLAPGERAACRRAKTHCLREPGCRRLAHRPSPSCRRCGRRRVELPLRDAGRVTPICLASAGSSLARSEAGAAADNSLVEHRHTAMPPGRPARSAGPVSRPGQPARSAGPVSRHVITAAIIHTFPRRKPRPASTLSMGREADARLGRVSGSELRAYDPAGAVRAARPWRGRWQTRTVHKATRC
jgi:hypothetical protein